MHYLGAMHACCFTSRGAHGDTHNGRLQHFVGFCYFSTRILVVLETTDTHRYVTVTVLYESMNVIDDIVQ